MKRLLSWLTGLVVIGGLLIGLLVPPSVSAAEIRNVADDKLAERGDKVDLNNSSVRRFQQFPGMYPTFAGKIVLGGPYENVDDVLDLDLSERQKELFEKYPAPTNPTGNPRMAAGTGPPMAICSNNRNSAVGALPTATMAPSSR